jgi:hypothetical protein
VLQAALDSGGFLGVNEAMENEQAHIKEAEMAGAFYISHSTKISLQQNLHIFFSRSINI